MFLVGREATVEVDDGVRKSSDRPPGHRGHRIRSWGRLRSQLLSDRHFQMAFVVILLRFVSVYKVALEILHVPCEC